MEPKESKNRSEFAQCGTCMMWTGPKGNTCTIHGFKTKVTADMSCGLYVEGDPMPDHAGEEMDLVTPEISGLVRQDVRCENCEHGDGEKKICNLYKELNELEEFELDEKIDPKGCCNAQTPRSKTIDSLREKANMMD